MATVLHINKSNNYNYTWHESIAYLVFPSRIYYQGLPSMLTCCVMGCEKTLLSHINKSNNYNYTWHELIAYLVFPSRIYYQGLPSMLTCCVMGCEKTLLSRAPVVLNRRTRYPVATFFFHRTIFQNGFCWLIFVQNKIYFQVFLRWGVYHVQVGRSRYLD